MATLSTNTCAFCRSKGIYRCSRCERSYCSAKCFKCVQHIECSEQFFKACVQQSLRCQQFDDNSKRKIIEILKRNAKQSEDIDFDELVDELVNEEQSIEDKFESININESTVEDIWHLLSDDERREFERLLESGDIGRVVSIWKPWWECRPKMVVEVDECVDECVHRIDDCIKLPEINANIAKLSALTSRNPSPSVCPAIISTLFSYAYVCRLYNGEYNSLESIRTLLETCPQLSSNLNCEHLRECLRVCVQHVMLSQPTSFVVQILRDLKCVVGGPKLKVDKYDTSDYVLRALSDIIVMINSVTKRERKALKLDLIEKKLQFYLSWSVMNGFLLCNCISDIDEEIDLLQFERKSNDFIVETPQKSFIEELT